MTEERIYFILRRDSEIVREYLENYRNKSLIKQRSNGLQSLYSIALDKYGRNVYLADSAYSLQMAEEKFDKIKFHFTSELII